MTHDEREASEQNSDFLFEPVGAGIFGGWYSNQVRLLICGIIIEMVEDLLDDLDFFRAALQ